MADITITSVTLPERIAAQTLQLGETVALYDILCKVDDKYVKTDAADPTLLEAAMIAMGSGVLDDWVVMLPLNGRMQLVGATLTQAEKLVLSATPGKIAQRADLLTGQSLVEVALAETTDTVWMSVDNTGILIP